MMKVVKKRLENVIGKHMYQSLFFDKVEAYKLKTKIMHLLKT